MCYNETIFFYYHIKSLHSYIIVTWVCGEGTVGQYGFGEVFVRPTMATWRSQNCTCITEYKTTNKIVRLLASFCHKELANLVLHSERSNIANKTVVLGKPPFLNLNDRWEINKKNISNTADFLQGKLELHNKSDNIIQWNYFIRIKEIFIETCENIVVANISFRLYQSKHFWKRLRIVTAIYFITVFVKEAGWSTN